MNGRQSSVLPPSCFSPLLAPLSLCLLITLTFLHVFTLAVQVCSDEGIDYNEGETWKKNCNRTTCECRSGEAQCVAKSCGVFRCPPGLQPGNPDPCGCNRECVGECNKVIAERK